MAGEGDAERLVVLLEMRTNDALKAIDRAEKKFTGSFGKMRRDSATATGKMEADMIRSTNSINRALAATSTKIGTFGKSLIAGFAGGLVAGGLAGIVSRLGQVASGVAAIGDEAKRAGIDIKSFQELKYVADQNRISVDALTDGMKELNLRADEWIVTGGGSAAEAFTRLGYTADELNTKLQDPSALLSEIIGKVQGLDRAAQIRIFDELFGGTGGEQFVQLIAQGEDGIRRTIDEANNLGIVLDEKVIAKAAEVDRKFNQVVNTVGSALKQAIVEATGALVEFMNSLPKSASQQFEDLTVEIDGTKDTLVQLANSAGNLFPELEPQIRDAVVQFLAGKTAAEDTKQALLDIAKGRPDLAPIIGDMNGLISTLEMVMARAREAAAAVAEASRDPINGGGPAATWENMQGMFFPKPRTVPGSGSASRDKEAQALERQEQAVKNLIAGLEFERSLIGLSALEQQKLTTLRQAGAAATDDQRKEIERLVTETYTEQMRIEQLQATFDMLGQVGMSAVEGIVDALEDGQITAEEFGDILGNVLNMAGQFFLNKGFGGFGGTFGFAGGGYTGPGGVNEPAGVVHKGEVVWSQRDVARAGGVSTVEAMRRGARGYADGGVVQPYSAPSAGPQRVQIDISVSVDESGNLVPIVKQVAGNEADIRIGQYDEGMPRRVRGLAGNKWQDY